MKRMEVGDDVKIFRNKIDACRKRHHSSRFGMLKYDVLCDIISSNAIALQKPKKFLFFLAMVT